MRLRSPAEFYIKHLLLWPDGYSDEEVIQLLDDVGLDYIDQKYIERVRKGLKPPSPFYPLDASHSRSQRFLVKSGLFYIFQPDDDMKTALSLVKKPRAKEFIEAMSLSGAPTEYMKMTLKRQFSVTCTSKALERYLYFFWNMDLVDATQLRVLLQMRYRDLNGEKGYDKMLRNAYFQDARKVAADLPYSPTSSMLAQMRMGLRPGRVEVAVQMVEARKSAILKGLEALERDGPTDSQRGLNHFQSARILTELLEMVIKPDQDLYERVQAITLRTDAQRLPSLKELSDGQHTTDHTGQKERLHDLIVQAGGDGGEKPSGPAGGS